MVLARPCDVLRLRERNETIRQALAGRVLVDLQRSGLSAGSLADFDRRHRERFAEYTFSAGLGASLQPLSALAWRRISGSDQPSERMTMLLAIRASAELARLRGLTEGYRIVARAQSSPPSAGQSWRCADPVWIGEATGSPECRRTYPAHPGDDDRMSEGVGATLEFRSRCQA
jgi:hypothetical protein